MVNMSVREPENARVFRLERALAEPDVAAVLKKLRAEHHLAVVAGPCADNLAVRTLPRPTTSRP